MIFLPIMVNKEIIVSDIQKSLNNSVCEDAGIIPVSIEVGIIEIGAMNPDFIRVKEVISDIKRRFNVEVILKQITSSEWEEWFENNSSKQSTDENELKNVIQDTSDEINIQSTSNEDISNDNQNDDLNNFNIIENDENNDSININYSNQTNNFHYESKEIEEKEIEEDAQNDKALIKLAQTNLGEDFENDVDSFFGDEITKSKDPVISGVGSLLSKCFSLNASDIHIEPLEDRLRIRYRIDGMLDEVFAFPRSHISPIVSRIKIMSNLDIAEKEYRKMEE